MAGPVRRVRPLRHREEGGTLLTVGVDLAAEDERTAVAWLDWTDGGCSVRRVRLGCSDAVVVEAVDEAEKAGIDCPLGWPLAFVEFVTAHRDGRVIAPDGVDREYRRRLAWRETDDAVHRLTGLNPLSVSADRIGRTAMRCAGLLSRISGTGPRVDRAGGGVVVEVYPAASLERWQLSSRGYKRASGAAKLGELMDELRRQAPWLRFGSFEAECRRSDDGFDAVVAALTARAAALGGTVPPDGEQAPAAAVEGWIAVPRVPLADLVRP